MLDSNGKLRDCVPASVAYGEVIRERYPYRQDIVRAPRASFGRFTYQVEASIRGEWRDLKAHGSDPVTVESGSKGEVIVYDLHRTAEYRLRVIGWNAIDDQLKDADATQLHPLMNSDIPAVREAAAAASTHVRP